MFFKLFFSNRTQSNIKEYKNDIDDMADLLNKNVETGNTNIKKLSMDWKYLNSYVISK